MTRYFHTASAAIALGLMAMPASVYGQAAQREQSTGEVAEDVATQPLRDVGVDEQEIPEILLLVQEAPYSLAGINGCRDIINGIRELDEVLGTDLDTREEASRGQRRRETAGSIGGSILGGLIPFRGIVREISGAAAQQRRYNQAVYAGVVRRSFLKGIGQERGCRVPGRPAAGAVTAVIPDTVPTDEDED